MQQSPSRDSLAHTYRMVDAKKFYAPEQPGVLHYEDVLLFNEIEALNIELMYAPYVEAEASKYGVPQDYKQIAFLKDESKNIPPWIHLDKYPVLREIYCEYMVFHALISILGGTDYWPNINDVRVHQYPSNTVGIGEHRDFSSNKNTVGILTINGNGVLTVGDKEFEQKPGTLTILRAPRKPDEDNRPTHKVVVGDARRCIIFRQVVKPRKDHPTR